VTRVLRNVGSGAGRTAAAPTLSLTRLLIGFAGAFCLVALLFVTTTGTSGSAVRHFGSTIVMQGNTASIPQTTTSDGLPDCGGVPILKSNGTPWTCTFDDEFNGTTLNTNNWSVVTTASSGYHSGSECYEDTPQNVNVSGGTLNLTLIKTSGFACKGMDTNFTTNYTAGAVNSDNNFSQTYGRFEVKAKFPLATIKGLQSSLWLWPVNDCAYGCKWPASGEIDIAEWYSQYPTLAIPYIHYNPVGGPKADTNVTNTNCSVTNENGYNTYAVEWNSQTITMIIDGQICMVDDWNPAKPEVKPDPFNLPFFVNLTAAMGIGTNSPTAQTASQLPATTNIDYVRAWS
jgi:beta-glucanase (GH16 family)